MQTISLIWHILLSFSCDTWYSNWCSKCNRRTNTDVARKMVCCVWRCASESRLSTSDAIAKTVTKNVHTYTHQITASDCVNVQEMTRITTLQSKSASEAMAAPSASMENSLIGMHCIRGLRFQTWACITRKIRVAHCALYSDMLIVSKLKRVKLWGVRGFVSGLIVLVTFRCCQCYI